MSLLKAGRGPLDLALTRGWREAVQVAMACAVAVMGFGVSFPTSVHAQEAPPAEVYAAIGRLNAAGYRTRRMCTATLVAPDTIITAAHCAPPEALEALRFVAGWDRGEFIAARHIKKITLHPRFQRPDAQNIPFDIAVLTLDAPIAEIAPLPLAEGFPVETLIAGYARTRPHVVSTRGPCPTRNLVGQLQQVTCPTEPGFSGAPVLEEGDQGWQVLGVVSASNSSTSFAVPVAGWALEVVEGGTA